MIQFRCRESAFRSTELDDCRRERYERTDDEEMNDDGGVERVEMVKDRVGDERITLRVESRR